MQQFHHQKVDLVVRKELTSAILNYTVVSCRIISLRIESHPMNLTIIQIYAPTMDDEEIEELYKEIEVIMVKVNTNT